MTATHHVRYLPTFPEPGFSFGHHFPHAVEVDGAIVGYVVKWRNGSGYGGTAPQWRVWNLNGAHTITTGTRRVAIRGLLPSG